jgi:neutral amino acid transport system permease protein
VEIDVFTPEGGPVGSARTKQDGTYEVPLEGPGAYVIVIDVDTLPAGVAVDEDDSPSRREVDVTPDERQLANFFLGESVTTLTSRWERLPQTVLNGVRFGLIIAICSIGLSLIYGTTGLSNFAHGELVTFGAILAWVADRRWGLPVLAAAPVGLLAGLGAGGVMERAVWRPLRRRGTSLTSMMIVSIGLAIFLRYFWQYTYGGRSQAFSQFAVQQALDLGPVAATPRDLVSMTICLGAVLGVGVFLLRTRLGKAVRAVSDNPDLASATGIDTDRVVLTVWLLGGFLAALGGVLLGLDQQLRWDSGASLLLLLFAGVTLGGLGSAFGALVGSLAIGMFVEMWTWVFPGVVELKTVGALAALILILLVRPQGLLGRKERIG